MNTERTNVGEDPLERASRLRNKYHALRDDMRTADREAVREGLERGLTATQIGAEIGLTAQRVYVIKRDLTHNDTTQ